MVAVNAAPATRNIIHRTRGTTRGPITRLVSPSDLGEVMKPFVFLDLAYFDGRSEPTPMEYVWHPHSRRSSPAMLGGCEIPTSA